MGVKYGIDLGTTNSSIAYAVDPTHVKIVQFHIGVEAPPYSSGMVSSKVYIPEIVRKDSDIQVGYRAQAAYRKFAGYTNAQLIERLKLTIEDNPEWHLKMGTADYSAADVFAKVLQILKKQADNDAKADSVSTDGVVIGAPVDFSDISKQIYIDALYKAGFYKSLYEAKGKTEFVAEPLAVAVTNGIDLRVDENVMVFDFGGGTLDVTVVNLKEQVNQWEKLHPLDVKAKRRITCGGELLTKLFFINSFCNKGKYGVAELAEAFYLPRTLTPEKLWERLMDSSDGQQFREEVEKLKCQLSVKNSVVFSFMGDDGVSLDDEKFTRTDFENSILGELQKMSTLVDQCLEDAHIEAGRIGEVILAGGSALIPCVQQLLVDKFGKNKVKLKNVENNQNEVLTSVVRGLAILGGKGAIINDIVDKDYGIIYPTKSGRYEFDPIIVRNTRIAETVANPAQGLGPHSPEYHPTCDLPERLHVTIGERTLNKDAVPIYSTEFEVNPHSQRYVIYMSVDAKNGMLETKVYDEDGHKVVQSFNRPIKQKEGQ